MACDRTNNDEPVVPDQPNKEEIPARYEISNFVYNDIVSGTLATYKAVAIDKDGTKKDMGLNSIVFGADNKIFLNGLFGYYYTKNNSFEDYDPWINGILDEGNDEILKIKNNTSVYSSSYSGNSHSNTSYIMCLVVINRDGSYKEVEDIEYLRFKKQSGGVIQFDVTGYPTLPNGSTYSLALKYKYYFEDSLGYTDSKISYTLYKGYVLTPCQVFPPDGLTWNNVNMTYDIYTGNGEYVSTTTTCKFAVNGSIAYILLDGCALKGIIKQSEIEFIDGQYVSCSYKVDLPEFSDANLRYGEEPYQLKTASFIPSSSWYSKDQLTPRPIGKTLKIGYDKKKQQLTDANYNFTLGGSLNYINVKFN